MNTPGASLATARRLRFVAVVVGFVLLLGLSTNQARSGEVPNRVTAVAVAAGDNALRATFQIGDAAQGATLTVRLDDGRTHVFGARVEAERIRKQVTADGQSVTKELTLPDAAINFSGLARYHSRPRLGRYTNEQQDDLIARWEDLPAASQRFIRFEARLDPAGVAFYLDGQYVGRRDGTGQLQSLEISLPPAGQVREACSFRHDQDPRFLPLDTRWIARPGVMQQARVSLTPGVHEAAEKGGWLHNRSNLPAGENAIRCGACPLFQQAPQIVGGVPLVVADGAASVDVGVVRECKGSWALECDEHLSRTALDGMPETAHFSVPQACYTRAWVLCAVDPDPERDPILTARLTRFATSGRGDAISDTTLQLPRAGETPPPDVESAGKDRHHNDLRSGVRKDLTGCGAGSLFPQAPVTPVGSVRYQKNGAAIDVPLLLVEFQLQPGEILDLLSMDEDPRASLMRSAYLDFEFLGKLDGVSAQWDRRHKPDKRSTSAVHVFGVTLERSPVSLRLDSSQPGNIFHNDQRPEMAAVLTADWPCEVQFRWKIQDVAGSVIREGSEPRTFAAAGEQQTVRLPLQLDTLGWYGIELALHDDRDRPLLAHSAACALLGQDTRRAGYDSPYGTWWFAGAHYGAGDKEIAGPMLFKAGLRKTTFGWCDYSEADMAPWKITLNQLGWGLAPRDMTDPQKAYDEAEVRVREMRARFPHCRSANLFHESYAHYIPPELLDERPDEDEAAARDGRLLVELGQFAARFYRERFPDVELLVGNTSSSASILATLLRHGFDPQYIDAIGVEAVGQTGMPELLWEGSTQGIWLAREVARKFGHDLPVTGCFEFTARTERNLGPQRQAEWIVRDMLLCHAYRFRHINPAILHDAGNAYHNTLWGAGGLCRRHPLLYPKPAYVAVATLTKVLDQVQPPRRVATGSTTVYALEFPRADGQRVYVLWTACGEATLRLGFSQPIAPTLVGFYGQPSPLVCEQGMAKVRCGTAPVYVIAPIRCDAIEVDQRRFAPPPDSFRVIDPLNDLAQWSTAEGESRLAQPTARGLPIRVPGEVALTRVDDDQRGPCLQLELRRQGTLPDIVGEYTRLKRVPSEPVMGQPTAVGVWVRGDSGWGKVIFEIEDAAGALWLSEGVWHDWPGDLAICHDGWRFMSFPLDGKMPVRNISPGARWTSTSPTRKSSIQFPIKLAGLSVVLNRKALDLTEMHETAGVLRFRDLGVIDP
jgi:hypothetical protein